MGRTATDTVVIELDDATLLDGLRRLTSTVHGHLADGGSRVVVDISGIRRLSSGTVAALLWTQRQCRSRGAHVTVRGPSRDSIAMLSRTGLQGVFDTELADRPLTGGRAR